MWRQTGLMAAGLLLAAVTAVAGTDRDTLLQITGQIAGDTVNLNREALLALPSATLVTSTVVTDGTHSFTGFLLRDLLDLLNAEGNHVTAVALNDYAVDIPMVDF